MKYHGVIKKNITDLNLPKWKAAKDILLSGKKKKAINLYVIMILLECI